MTTDCEAYVFTTSTVPAGDVEDGLVQLVELLEQRCPRRQHGLGDLLKHGVSSDESAGGHVLI